MNKTDEHNQIAKKLIVCIPHQSFNVKMLLQITNACYQQHQSVVTQLD